MIIIKAIFALGFGTIMLWGCAESYTRNKYGAFSPQHAAVISLVSVFTPAPPADYRREAKRQPGRS